MITHSEARAWSLLGPTPVSFYVEQADAYGVAWKGIFMSQKQAVQLAAFGAFKLAPTPRAKNISMHEFFRLYMCGGFGDLVLSNDALGSDNWNYVCKTVLRDDSVKNLLKTLTPAQLFEWFPVYNNVNNTALEQGN